MNKNGLHKAIELFHSSPNQMFTYKNVSIIQSWILKHHLTSEMEQTMSSPIGLKPWEGLKSLCKGFAN